MSYDDDDSDLFGIGLAVCPYCGEPVEIESAEDDDPGGASRFIEDCWVCCRPIEFSVEPAEDGPPRVTLRRLDD